MNHMEAITRTIIEYINNSNTLGALQIDGPWGCGKTYYTKKVLLPIIEQNEIDRENNGMHEKRIPLMISLFGIKSINEISRQLLFASTQSRFGLSEKRIDGLKKSFSNFAKCVPYLKEIDWDKALQIPPDACLKLLGEDAIIILDDLERLSSDIETEDVLGFVNDLVENYNFKVILISNQEHIGKNAILFKEKVIDKTIPFDIDTFSIIQSMADKFHPLMPHFIELENVRRYLRHIPNNPTYNKVISNLRTIRFALSQFTPLFQYYIGDIDKFEEISDITIKKLSIIWRFTLAISIEYRLGNVSLDKVNNLENAGMRFVLDRLLLDGDSQNIEQKEPAYEDLFIQQYYEPYDVSYLYIPDVYNLNGGVILFEKVDKIVSKELGVWDDSMDEESLYVSKFYDKISTLTDDEAPREFSKFLDLISKGYANKISDILNAANILFSYIEVIGISSTDIENAIIKGIDAFTIKLDEDTLNSQEHTLQMFSGNMREEAKPCLQYAYNKIKAFKQVKKEGYVSMLNHKFGEDMKSFAKEFMPYQVAPNIYVPSESILHLMNLQMVRAKMQNITSMEIENLYEMLYYRFGERRLSAFPEEKEFLLAIKEGLNTLSDEDKTLSAHFKRHRLIPFINQLLGQ